MGAIAALGLAFGPAERTAAMRILLAAAFGAAIGWERERHGRAAGLRTHLLLAVGCALVMQVSLHVPSLFAGMGGDGVLRVDPGRIAAQVLSGLGFLGAGAIIVLGRHIRGLTTAACIWVTAAIGLAVGCGFLFPALFTFVVVMFALILLGRWESRMQTKDRYVSLRLRFGAAGQRIEAVREFLAGHGLRVLDYRVDLHPDGAVYRLQLRYNQPVHCERVSTELARRFRAEGLSSVEWD